jgi:hypothetical protein
MGSIPSSGPLSIGMFNEALNRKDNFEDSALSGAATPTASSLVYIAGQLGTLNQAAPHAFSEWYSYTTNATTTTTTSTTTSTTTAYVDCTLTGGSAVQLCNITITEIQTTAPNNQAGNNGTATVSFVNAAAPVTYALNGVTGPSSVTSPFTISNLSANTNYTVAIKDANSCSTSQTFKTGDSTFTFVADYIMLTYEFTNGSDLDTRTRIVTPNVGQTSQSTYLGWARQSQWPNPSAAPFEVYGGDNQGTGFESVLIYIPRLVAAYPSTTELVVDLRAFWYGTVGSNPVLVAGTLWRGGTPVKNGCIFNGTPFCWTNPTAAATFTIDSVGKVITSATRDRNTSGQRVATLTYTLANGSGVFNNNDTTTPSV